MSETETFESLTRRFDSPAPMPHRERWEIGKRAERLAEESGDKRALYEIRMRLVGFAFQAAEATEQLTLFLWCAHMHDSDPVRYPTRPIESQPDVDLLWWYKWLTVMLLSYPQYSLAQVRSALDMMRAAYRREGAGEAGILWAELSLALDTGRTDEARDVLARIKAAPPDEYSNCDACARAQEATILWQMENNEEAGLRLVDEILENGYECAEEPQSIVSEALFPLARAGRLPEAAALAEFAYPLIMSSPMHLSHQIDHMLFLLATGNPRTAAMLFVRHLPNVRHEGLPPSSSLAALKQLVVVASELSREGYGAVEIEGVHGEATTIEGFIESARTEARPLAAAFDKRDGTSDRVESLENAGTTPLERFEFELGG